MISNTIIMYAVKHVINLANYFTSKVIKFTSTV